MTRPKLAFQSMDLVHFVNPHLRKLVVTFVEFLNLFKASTFFGGVQSEQFCQRITNLNNSVVNSNFVKRVGCSQLFPLLAVSAQLTVRALVTGLLGSASVVMVDSRIFDPNTGKTVRTPGEPLFSYSSFNALLDSAGVAPARIPTEGSEDIFKV
jgi:hypothetical protein